MTKLFFSTFIEFYVDYSDPEDPKTVVTKKFTNPMKNKGTGADKKLKQKSAPTVITSEQAGTIEL